MRSINERIIAGELDSAEMLSLINNKSTFANTVGLCVQVLLKRCPEDPRILGICMDVINSTRGSSSLMGQYTLAYWVIGCLWEAGFSSQVLNIIRLWDEVDREILIKFLKGNYGFREP